MAQLRPLLVFGTRPEAIKMAPVVRECKRRAAEVDAVVCLTGQHREMLAQVTTYFDIQEDVNLQLMTENQSLSTLTAHCIERLDEVIQRYEPDCVVAQGDTTSVLAAAMVAFYRRVPFVHVEAGLRTGNLAAPWPEEMNRRYAGIVASMHCAPTHRAAEALLAEGVSKASVHLTGNTVIDALLATRERERTNSQYWNAKYDMLGDRRMVLVTGHRRENFGQGFESICDAIAELAQQFPECVFVYPVHLNPNVREPVQRRLGKLENVQLSAPASYPEFVWLMDRSTLILTDSGGVQEEAPSLKKPVLVMRETTERPEAVEAGAARLVGTSAKAITATAASLLMDPEEYRRWQVDSSPYGDGKAAERIVELLVNRSFDTA